VAVDGEAHRDEGGDEGYGEHCECAQNDVEEAIDGSGDFSGEYGPHVFSEYSGGCGWLALKVNDSHVFRFLRDGKHRQARTTGDPLRG